MFMPLTHLARQLYRLTMLRVSVVTACVAGPDWPPANSQ